LLASALVKAAPVNCELLVGIEDFGLAVTSESVLQCLDAEGRSIVIDSRQDRTRRSPVQDDSGIDEATRHRDVVMSIAQTWVRRVIALPRSRYG